MRTRRLFPLTLGLLLAATALAPTAAAHEHVMVADKYELTIGWIEEPPYVDAANGVWVRVLGPAPELDTELFGPGESVSHTFHETGTVSYHCHPHPWMKGNVTVVDAGRKTPEVHHVTVFDGPDQDDHRFVPENLVISKGDKVVWTSAASNTMEHQVMDDAVAHEHDGHGHHDGHDEGAHHDEEAHHDEQGHGGHAHGAVAPVTGVEQTMQVEVSIGGKSRTFELDTVWGEPGVYVARFIPTVAGTYTVHFTGTIDNETVDVTTEIQRVEAASGAQFPESPGSLQDLRKEVAALKEQLDTQAQTPADVDADANTPFPGVLALAAVAVIGATLMRRRA